MIIYIIAVLIAIIWIMIALWILEKRDWYNHKNTEADSFSIELYIGFSIIFMPINLIIIFVKEFIISKWDN